MTVKTYADRMQKVCRKIEVFCDKCKKPIKRYSNSDKFECTFEHRTGEAYPEGGSGELQTFDFCQICAKDVIQILENAGCTVINSEWEW